MVKPNLIFYKNNKILFTRLIIFILTSIFISFYILYLYEFMLNINTFLFIILIPLIISPLFFSKDIMHPFIVFLITSQFLFIFNMMDFNANKGTFRYGSLPSDYYDTAFAWSILVIIIWYVSMYLGYFLYKNNSAKSIKVKEINNPISISIILVILGISSYIYIVSLQGGLIGIIDALSRRAEAYSGYGYFIKLTGLITISSIIILSRGYKKTSFIIVLISFLLLASFGGRSSAFFGSIFPYLLYYHYRIKKVRYLQLITLAIISIIFAIGMGNYRLYQEFKLDITGFYDMISKIARNTQGGETLPSLVGSLIKGELDYQYGTTLINILYAPIPRSLWSDKPQIDESGIVGRALMGSEYWGLPPGPYGISFFNFSFIGVIIIGFITGMIIKKLYIGFVINYHSDYGLMIYILIFPKMFHVVSTSTQIDILWYLGIFVLIKLIDILISSIKRKKLNFNRARTFNNL